MTFENCDCMELMARYPDKHFDLAIVDPPYGIGNFSPISGSVGTKCSGNKWDIKWNNKVPKKKYFKEIIRISKNRIIWGANYYNCFENGNGAIIWHKGNINPQFSQCEIASLSFQKKVDYYFQNWQGGGNWHHDNIHPCQKPIALYKWLLTKYAKPGWLILDTHVGSASSLIACEDLGFDYVGCELDADYYRAACERIENYRAQPKLISNAEQFEQNSLDI